MNHPLMKCGHAATGINNKTGKPACISCIGDPRAEQIEDNPPDLSHRKARCAYYGITSRGNFKCESNYGTKPNSTCLVEEPSDTNLPFFEYKPDKEYDVFYCGCHGWD